jgi:hypothetical protein
MEVKTANEKGGIRQIHSQFTTEHAEPYRSRRSLTSQALQNEKYLPFWKGMQERTLWPGN